MTVSAMMMRRFSAVASVTEESDLETVADKIMLHNIGAVVVLTTAGRLVGIITDNDLVKAMSRHKSQFPTLKAREIMDPEVHTCRSDETELEIMAVMSEKQIRHMAVVVGENVVGLVTLDEAVRHRLQKIKQLTETAHEEADNDGGLALVNQHLKETWNIFEVFRAVIAVQEQTGLEKLDDRARQLLWVIGDADNAGKLLQVSDLTESHKLGTFPTVRKHLDELIEAGLIEDAASSGGRAKRFQLSQRGRDIFRQMSNAVSDRLVPLAAGSFC
jgi:CBS domain-containing protein